MQIEWESEGNSLLFNPHLALEEKEKAQHLLEHSSGLKGHMWIATSGSHALSPGHLKWTALSKEAVLISANSVNTFLNCSSQDRWLSPLPYFHVGGLGILARSHLKGFKVINYYGQNQGKWKADSFWEMAHSNQATLSSLVSAQVFDLVKQKLSPPSSMRAVLVGGGAIHSDLLSKARELGWPLLPSYGLTECASTVACSPSADSCDMQLLSHVKADINPSGLIRLQSPSLLSLYAYHTDQGLRYHDPKENGWLTTEDRGELQNDRLKILGRSLHMIKIGGEKVDLLVLERILEEARLSLKVEFDMALVTMPDDRLEHVIHLAVTTSNASLVEPVLLFFNQRVMPYEKIRAWHFLEHIPRTALFKLKTKELLAHLLERNR